MQTLNFAKLAKRAIGLASFALAGAAVALPVTAQVETSPVEDPSAEEVLTPEATELSTPDVVVPTETIESGAETLTPETEPVDATTSTEVEKVDPSETTETTETPASETEELAPTDAETTESEELAPTDAETTESEELAPTDAETTESEELAPETTEAPTPEAPGIAAGSGTIVDVASASDTFQTLVAALTEAELTEVLAGEGPFTVFAPTDEAFEDLPEGTVDALLLPENRETLVKILSYHVVPGSITSDDLSSGDVATVEGSPVTVTVGEGMVMVNEASVIQPDIPASNGVIHAIDRVILPPDLQQQ
jgi:uncharacterized surface protein with fasciclin (FAS1) repeats